ncbi:MAG: hypothetical protein CO079_04140 [Nitrosopumilales archaeon CG_4_9_14_0_8_um_filter_34_10]|nr:MAG: hypothetical protein CO079_04140 [Nitrosopumilales archaeon CG_4_9_14_0_8_um_filter_34_10]
MSKHIQVIRLVFSNIYFLVLSGIIFVSMFVLLLYVQGLLFFEPYFIFNVTEDVISSFISILVVSLLTSIVTAISIFQISMIKTSSKKAGAGIVGSALSAGSGICTSCSTVGFSIASSFGIAGATAVSFLNDYEIPIRIAAIGILVITYFSMINKITTGCKISPKNNDHNPIQ